MSREQELLAQGKAVLGIELGSTRIKAVVIDTDGQPIASGEYDWENRLENGIWTYSMDQIRTGLQGCYSSLREKVQARYGVELISFAAIGISGMMHGYLPFDREGHLLAEFRTWRNTITGEAADELTELFQFNIPQRWSIAHLYQAMLKGEEHVERLACLTTLSSYIHWQLTGRRVIGIGEASGMFPIDSDRLSYEERFLQLFQRKVEEKGYTWKIAEVLPEVLTAGDDAGSLTEEGAKFLDVSGHLKAGIPLCPPEGDAGTGMVATNSVRQKTGNISAGTSSFAMIVLEKGLKRMHRELDLVTTPDGSPVAMVHCNNCTSDLDAWVRLFDEFAKAAGLTMDKSELYGLLYRKALEGDEDCGGLLTYNYFAGEHITGFDEGRPLLVRTPDSHFTLANLMRANLFTTMGVIRTGCDILFDEEGVEVEEILGHGGLFKTKGVAQRFVAAAMKVPVSVMETAGEGGAWGIALLAAYRIEKQEGESLPDYLERKVFAGQKGERIEPEAQDVRSFERFMKRYTEGLAIERAAVEHLR